MLVILFFFMARSLSAAPPSTISTSTRVEQARTASTALVDAVISLQTVKTRCVGRLAEDPTYVRLCDELDARETVVSRVRNRGRDPKTVAQARAAVGLAKIAIHKCQRDAFERDASVLLSRKRLAAAEGAHDIISKGEHLRDDVPADSRESIQSGYDATLARVIATWGKPTCRLEEDEFIVIWQCEVGSSKGGDRQERHGTTTQSTQPAKRYHTLCCWFRDGTVYRVAESETTRYVGE